MGHKSGTTYVRDTVFYCNKKFESNKTDKVHFPKSKTSGIQNYPYFVHTYTTGKNTFSHMILSKN